jgi:short-subunit dehydrogenase
VTRALVTGASSGIGASFARALRARGFRLVLAARRADRLKQLADELGGDDTVTVVPIDLAEDDAARRLHNELQTRGLPIDLLVNNAGLGHTGRFWQAPRERLLEVVDVNVRALVELTHAFLPGMIDNRAGAVINVVSMAAFQPVPYFAVYAASKAFVLSFTEALATELAGTGVYVQALCPGNIPTEFQASAGTDKVPFDRTPGMSADAVVAASLAAFDERRLTVVPRLQDRLMVAAQVLLPRSVVRQAGAALFKPRD